LLFVVSSLVAHLLVTFRIGRWQIYLRELAGISFGLLPVLAVVFYFKTQVAPPSELINAMGDASVMSKIIDYHRYSYIAHQFFRFIFHYDGGSVNLIYVMLIYLVCIGVAIKKRSSVLQLSLTLCLMLAGYAWAYLTTPYDLAWHMRYSMDRLLLQIWPGFVLVYFLTVRTLEDTFLTEELLPSAKTSI
jgi:hypothetical protein